MFSLTKELPLIPCVRDGCMEPECCDGSYYHWAQDLKHIECSLCQRMFVCRQQKKRMTMKRKDSVGR